MLSFKAILFNLLWTLVTTAVLSHAAAIPGTDSSQLHRRQDENRTGISRPQAFPTPDQLRDVADKLRKQNGDDFTAGLANTPIPQTSCAGPESISSAEFIMEPGLGSETVSCQNLLRELQLGGRARFVQSGSDGFSADGNCRVFWSSRDVNPAQVSFDDLVAPVALALARGQQPDEHTGGVLKNYRLAGVCTDVSVGFVN